MYVTKLTDGTLISRGITFKSGARVAVGSEDFDYLKKTFKNIFKFEGETKPKRTRASTKKQKE